MDGRLIHYLIVWILCLKGTNRAQCIVANLLIIYGMLNNVSMDWSNLIINTMLKAKRYPAYTLPNSLLISRICDYKDVNKSGEHVQRTIEANQSTESSLKQNEVCSFRKSLYSQRWCALKLLWGWWRNYCPTSVDVGSSSGVDGPSSSMEEKIANMNRRMEELFFKGLDMQKWLISLGV